MIDRVRKRVARGRFKAGIGRCATCPLERIGSEYGGWWIPPDLIDPSSVVYGVGLGEDSTFDLGMIERFGCEVWAFDPTPRAIVHAASISHPRFHFRPWAVWSHDGTLPFYMPSDESHVSHSLVDAQETGQAIEADCRTLHSIQRELGHTVLDVLKLDIEGAEYDVLRQLQTRPRVLCVEFHPIAGTDPGQFVRSLDYVPVRVEGWNVTFIDRRD